MQKVGPVPTQSTARHTTLGALEASASPSLPVRERPNNQLEEESSGGFCNNSSPRDPRSTCASALRPVPPPLCSHRRSLRAQGAGRAPGAPPEGTAAARGLRALSLSLCNPANVSTLQAVPLHLWSHRAAPGAALGLPTATVLLQKEEQGRVGIWDRGWEKVSQKPRTGGRPVSSANRANFEECMCVRTVAASGRSEALAPRGGTQDGQRTAPGSTLPRVPAWTRRC